MLRLYREFIFNPEHSRETAQHGHTIEAQDGSIYMLLLDQINLCSTGKQPYMRNTILKSILDEKLQRPEIDRNADDYVVVSAAALFLHWFTAISVEEQTHLMSLHVWL